MYMYTEVNIQLGGAGSKYRISVNGSPHLSSSPSSCIPPPPPPPSPLNQPKWEERCAPGLRCPDGQQVQQLPHPRLQQGERGLSQVQSTSR